MALITNHAVSITTTIQWVMNPVQCVPGGLTDFQGPCHLSSAREC